MMTFALRAAGPSASPRTHLSLHALESRLTPAAPQIVDLMATGMGDGWFVITGQVIDENPWGLSVEFSADCHAFNGYRAECEEDGRFSLFVQVDQLARTDVIATTINWDNEMSDPVAIIVG